MPKHKPGFESKFRDGAEIDRAIEMAVLEALEEHKRRKNLVAAWDGHAVVIVHPEDIPSLKDKPDNDKPGPSGP